MQLLLVFSLFFFGSSVWAAHFSCPGIASFPVENCDDNERLGREALQCARRYRDHVQKAQAEIYQEFQAQIAQLKEMQSDTFDRTSAGYKEARQRLEILIADGLVARTAVDELQAGMIFPEDYDQPAVTGMSTEEYLRSEACYAIPQKVMLQCQAVIDKMMGDIRATETAMFGKQGRAQARSSRVQRIEQSREAAHTKGRGPEDKRVPGGKSRAPASDITGVKAPGSDDMPK